MKLFTRLSTAVLLGGTVSFGLVAAENGVPIPEKSVGAVGSRSTAVVEQASEGATNRFLPIDLFDLETASDPRISPDGTQVVFVRNFSDIMKDRRWSNLWIVRTDGADLRPLTSGNGNDSSPRWSPDGKRLLYLSVIDGSPQIHVRWMDSGEVARVTRLSKPPGAMDWSPDGRWIVFDMAVSDDTKPFAEMPAKPEGAEWAKPPKTIRRMI